MLEKEFFLVFKNNFKNENTACGSRQHTLFNVVSRSFSFFPYLSRGGAGLNQLKSFLDGAAFSNAKMFDKTF